MEFRTEWNSSVTVGFVPWDTFIQRSNAALFGPQHSLLLSCRARQLPEAISCRCRKNNKRCLHPFDFAQGKTFGRHDNSWAALNTYTWRAGANTTRSIYIHKCRDAARRRPDRGGTPAASLSSRTTGSRLGGALISQRVIDHASDSGSCPLRW